MSQEVLSAPAAFKSNYLKKLKKDLSPLADSQPDGSDGSPDKVLSRRDFWGDEKLGRRKTDLAGVGGG